MTYRAVFVDGGLAVAGWKASGSLRPFVRRLLDLRAAHLEAVIGVAWDCPRGESWRRKRSAVYKAGRPPTEPGFTAALDALRADLPALDVLQFAAPGAEADDVLYSLSVTRPGPTLIVSGDKDLVQCIRPGVDLLKTAHDRHGADQLLTAATLPGATVKLAGKPITGLDARGWGSLLALCGDTTDGVRGLPKVGPVTAQELLRACPDFVELLLDPCKTCERRGQAISCPRLGRQDVCPDMGGIADARRACNAASATLARWVERAIEHLPELRTSRELVRLRLVEVDCVDAEPDAERVRSILEGAGLC